MKRVVKFIVFKIAEIIGAFLLWWGLSWYGLFVMNTIIRLLPPLDFSVPVEKWFFAPAFGFLLGIAAPIIIIFVIYVWIMWNWEKAGK